MKKMLVILFAVFSLNTYAQSSENYLDIVYLKNGKEVKGIIQEQKIGESIKIKTLDGSIRFFNVSEIVKLEKELKPEPKWMNNFKEKKKGWFIEAEGLVNFTNTARRSFNITNGYKFNRFAYLGFGLGIGYEREYWYSYMIEPVIELNLNFSGDMMNKRITPYYQINAGYSFLPNRSEDIIIHIENGSLQGPDYSFTGSEREKFGGPYGEMGLGVRIKSQKKVYYKFGIDMRIGANLNSSKGIYFDKSVGLIETSPEYKAWNSYGSFQLRFGIGF